MRRAKAPSAVETADCSRGSLALTANALVMGQIYHSQIASNLDLFPGPRGDTRLTAYLLEHWYQTLCGNAALLSPAMFYPVKGALGRSDALLAYVLPFSGLRVSGLDIFSALAVAVIALQFMNFVACFFLLHNGLGFKALASGAGALFFAFNNPKLAQSDHLQLQPLIFLLLTVVFLVLFFSRFGRSEPETGVRIAVSRRGLSKSSVADLVLYRVVLYFLVLSVLRDRPLLEAVASVCFCDTKKIPNCCERRFARILSWFCLFFAPLFACRLVQRLVRLLNGLYP